MSADSRVIYALKDPDDGTIRYVGQCRNLWRRMGSHLRDQVGSPVKQQWFEDLQHRQVFPLPVVLEMVPADQALTRERWWIAHFSAQGHILTNHHMTATLRPQDQAVYGAVSDREEVVAPLEEVFTPIEVAGALGLSPKTVLQYLREGRLPGFRVGKHWRIRHADLAAMVQLTPHPMLVAPVAQEPDAEADMEPEADAHPYPTPDLIDPQQRRASLVARLRALKAQGYSLQAIATQLNADGVPTISGKGAWQKGTIANLLAEGEEVSR